LISEGDLKLVRAYHNHGHNLLSVYLPLDTPARRQTACDEFARQVQACMDNGDPPPGCRESIQEDVDIVSLYLSTNANRCGAGLAIFSCAADLFWRAFSLPVPVATQVAVGSRFNTEPLLQVVALQRHSPFRPAYAERRVAVTLS
jgi:hypothetical protein